MEIILSCLIIFPQETLCPAGNEAEQKGEGDRTQSQSYKTCTVQRSFYTAH